MISDRLLELGGLASLQKIANDVSPWAALATLLLIASVGVIVDYARMLWLRSKMVSVHEHTILAERSVLTFLSHPALYPCQSWETPSTSLKTSHGSGSKNYPSNTTAP